MEDAWGISSGWKTWSVQLLRILLENRVAGSRWRRATTWAVQSHEGYKIHITVKNGHSILPGYCCTGWLKGVSLLWVWRIFIFCGSQMLHTLSFPCPSLVLPVGWTRFILFWCAAVECNSSTGLAQLRVFPVSATTSPRDYKTTASSVAVRIFKYQPYVSWHRIYLTKIQKASMNIQLVWTYLLPSSILKSVLNMQLFHVMPYGHNILWNHLHFLKWLQLLKSIF